MWWAWSTTWDHRGRQVSLAPKTETHFLTLPLVSSKDSRVSCIRVADTYIVLTTGKLASPTGRAALSPATEQSTEFTRQALGGAGVPCALKATTEPRDGSQETWVLVPPLPGARLVTWTSHFCFLDLSFPTWKLGEGTGTSYLQGLFRSWMPRGRLRTSRSPACLAALGLTVCDPPLLRSPTSGLPSLSAAPSTQCLWSPLISIPVLGSTQRPCPAWQASDPSYCIEQCAETSLGHPATSRGHAGHEVKESYDDPAKISLCPGPAPDPARQGHTHRRGVRRGQTPKLRGLRAERLTDLWSGVSRLLEPGDAKACSKTCLRFFSIAKSRL